MKTLVTSNVFTNPESMNQAPYLSIYTWLNALFIVKKLVFRNQFFLFPDKDILSSQSLSRHSAYGRQKNASSNRVQTISGFADSIINTFMFLLYSTVSVWRFSGTHFSTPTHVQVWECAEILLIFAHQPFAHTFLLVIAHKIPHPHLTWYKNVLTHSQFAQQASKRQISQWLKSLFQ